MAMATVSRSRSSPTRMMSGSSRSAARSASLNEPGMSMHLALVDQALLIFVHELDWILDRDDVILPGPVDVIDHRAQRGRLARAGGPGDQHQPLVQFAQLQDVGRQTELLGGQDLRRDDTKHRTRPAAICEHVRSEAGQLRNLVGEVGVVPIGVLLPVFLRHDRRQERHQVVPAQHRRLRVERLHVSVLADHRRRADAEMQVRRARIAHGPEHLIDRRSAHVVPSEISTMWALLTMIVWSSPLST